MIETVHPTLAQTAVPSEFYQTLSGLSFTLLGLWAVVLELRFRAAKADVRERRHIYGVLLFFLLPGLMSLFSIIDDSSLWWRLVFGITACIGAAEILFYFQAAGEGPSSWDVRLRAAGLLDYLLILLIAFRPAIPADLGLGLRGIQVEAILVTGLLVIRVHMVFLAIVERADVVSG